MSGVEWQQDGPTHRANVGPYGLMADDLGARVVSYGRVVLSYATATSLSDAKRSCLKAAIEDSERITAALRAALEATP